MSLGSQERAILATLRPRLVSGFVDSRGIDQGVSTTALGYNADCEKVACFTGILIHKPSSNRNSQK